MVYMDLARRHASTHHDVVVLAWSWRTSLYGIDNLSSDLGTDGRVRSRTDHVEKRVLLIRRQVRSVPSPMSDGATAEEQESSLTSG